MSNARITPTEICKRLDDLSSLLKAMASNYAAGHSVDHLDIDAFQNAAAAMNSAANIITDQAANIERLTNECMEERAARMMWGDKNAELTRVAGANLDRAKDAEAALEKMREALGAAQCVDEETAKTLLDLLNPLHGALDLQTYDERYKQEFNAPKDAEYSVNVTAQMERDIQQAVIILERRLSPAALTTQGGAAVTPPGLMAALTDALVEIDAEIEQRQYSGSDENWAGLKAISDRGHVAIAKAKGGAAPTTPGDGE